jgi:putative membrane protein
MMRQFYQLLVRVGANACGIFFAAQLVSKISYGDDFVALLITALILSILNAVIRPLVVIFSLPAYIITLGLFSLVVNAMMLYLVDFLYAPFEVQGLLAPILAGIIIGLVNYIVTRVFDTVSEEEKR